MSLGTMRDLSLDHARRISMLANWATFAFAGAIFFVGALLLGVI
jgi:hypothetical protein